MKRYLVLSLALVATGCTSKTPLVFVSKTSVGVEVSAPGTGTGEFVASIGVNTLDAAYVPVVERIKNGTSESVHEVKSGESLTEEQRANLAAFLANQISIEKNNISAAQATLAGKVTPETREQGEKAINEANQKIQNLSEDLSNVLSRVDALSVFSAFDSNTLLRADAADQGIGKVFATGLAAQHVARNFSQQAQAQASCKDKIAPTVAKLAEVGDQTNRDYAIKLLEACE
ncbi:hypothetical protein [Pseudomonas sp. MC6]